MKRYLLALLQWFHSPFSHSICLICHPYAVIWAPPLLSSFGWVVAWKNMLINITSSMLLGKPGLHKKISRYCIQSRAIQHQAESWKQNRMTSCSVCVAEWTFRKKDSQFLEIGNCKASSRSKPCSPTLDLAFLRTVSELGKYRRPGGDFCLQAWLDQNTANKRGWSVAPNHVAYQAHTHITSAGAEAA